MATTTKSKKLTTEQYKELLSGERKEIRIDLSPSALTGKWDTIVKRIKKLVDDSEIEGDWTIKNTKVQGYSRYDYRTGRYTGGDGYKYYIIGYRDYTDAEIEVLGAKLLADKVRREARELRERKKNIAQYNKVAAKLGLDPLVEPEA